MPVGQSHSSLLLCPGERLLMTLFDSPDPRDPEQVTTTVLSWHPETGSSRLYSGTGPLFLWGCG